MKRLFLPLLVLLLNGCAFGQTLDYDSGAFVFDTDRIAEKQATIIFYDQRPYVLSGNKNPNFVGLLRSLGGIPYPVTTKSGRDMVADFAILMRNTLKAKGWKVTVFSVPHYTKSEDIPKIAAKNGGGDTLLLFTFYEWKTDTYIDPTLHFNLHLTAMDKNGRVLGEVSEQGVDGLGAGQRAERVSLGAASSDILGSLLNADSTTSALGGVIAGIPIIEKYATNTEPPGTTGTPNCTTASILGMKELGMSDTQIKAACPDATGAEEEAIAVAVFPFARSGTGVFNDADHLLPEFAHQYVSENRQLRLSASYFKQEDSKIGSQADYWSATSQPLNSRIFSDGARIDADVVLMYSYLGRYTMEDSFDVTVYLFDIKNRRAHQSSGNQNNYKRVTESLFKKITAIQ